MTVLAVSRRRRRLTPAVSTRPGCDLRPLALVLTVLGGVVLWSPLVWWLVGR